MTVNSALEILSRADALSFEVKVSSTYLKTFFPNFEEVFGHHEKVKITLDLAADSGNPPKIKIQEGTSSLEGNAEIVFLNPYNDEFEAVLMKCNIEIEVEFELLSDFTLIGNFKNISLSVTDFEAYF